MRKICFIYFITFTTSVVIFALRDDASFPESRIRLYRQKVKDMFYHAYNGYLEYAYPYDELKPLTCTGMDTWGSFSLSLVDALDTLVIMGNYSEFRRAAQLVLKHINVDANVNVSVFETNIRVIGGLITAHLFSEMAGESLEDGWPCYGPLLRLAQQLADKLLPAFNTKTGMPYGTVNLKYGVHKYETPITCTAGVGTFLLEFGSLSTLTGNEAYRRVAEKAMQQIWSRKSSIGLLGNHIDVETGTWTATDAGIGAGVDSYFEYLVKGAALFDRADWMKQFKEYRKSIEKYMEKDDWFVWVSMSQGQVTMPVFQSLEAFWPGVLTLVGDVDEAARILLNYYQVVRQYGFVPEFYNIYNAEAMKKRSGYPLRPEFIESLMYLYRATKDPIFLQIGSELVDAIESSSKTKCGYATVQDVQEHILEDRMESFFLAETTKYLYLLFDTENFIHNPGKTAKLIQTPSGPCVVGAGGYIFNTEAHPIDPAMLYCCSQRKQKHGAILREFEDNIDLAALLGLVGENEPSFRLKAHDLNFPQEAHFVQHPNLDSSEETPENESEETQETSTDEFFSEPPENYPADYCRRRDYFSANQQLDAMLNAMYRRSVDSCRWSDAPVHERHQYTSAKPEWVTSSLEEDYSASDAYTVTDMSKRTFYNYTRLAEQSYDVMACPARSYAARVSSGNGFVLPRYLFVQKSP